jgi:hypothetical protein
MPCLTGQFDPAVGPLIEVAVGQAGIVPATAVRRYSGLIDTGATMTSISPKVVSTLALKPLGKRAVVSATHVVAMNLYLVDLLLIFTGGGVVRRGGIEVLEFAPPKKAAFDMLIGRDVLCEGVLTLSPDCRFTFAL